MLKTEAVPPVCPSCPQTTACGKKKPCPPCPPCGRCPKNDNYHCKKVPNYSSNNPILPGDEGNPDPYTPAYGSF